MFPPRNYSASCFLLSLLLLSTFTLSLSQSHSAAKKKRMREKVRQMFYHAYDNYMTHAFPHDELKPLTKSFTDSLSELGNLKLEHLPQDYRGSALTLIESLSSLVIMGNNTEFERAVLWLSENLTFDVDARINLFECNIRVLGGLVSAHLLASDPSKKLFQGAYNNQLLVLAEDLGKRFLPAFNTPTGLPYAWINLKGDEGEPDAALKRLWAAPVPSNVKAFAWKLMLNRIPCRQQLQRRGVIDAQSDVSCALCHEEVETSAHLMMSCSKVLGLWEACNTWLNSIYAPSLGPISEHFLHFPHHGRNATQRHGEYAVWLALTWSVWLLRNEILFGTAVYDQEYLLDIIQYRSWNWIRNRMKGVCFSLYEWKTNPDVCLLSL